MNADTLITMVLDEGMRIDNHEGIGNTGNNLEVGYKGFMVKMKPREFLALNPEAIDRDPGDRPVYNLSFWNKDRKEYIGGRKIGRIKGDAKDFKEVIKKGRRGVGAPFIQAEWDEKGKRWQVYGHEGRHRMIAAHELWPEKDVTVHILPSGKSPSGARLQADNLTDDHLFAPLIPDERTADGKVFMPTKVIHNKQFRTRPDDWVPPPALPAKKPKAVRKPRKKKESPKFVPTSPPAERTKEHQQEIDDIMQLLRPV